MSDPNTPPAGWYDDGSGRQRWWDGKQWGPFAEQATEAQPVSTPPNATGTILVDGDAPKAKQPWFKNKFVWIGAAAVLLFAFIGINAMNENRELEQSPAPTPEATAVHTTVTIPDLVGQDGASARDALTELGLTVEFKGGDDTVLKPSNWTVDSQDPATGTAAQEGSVVTLKVSKPVSTEEPADPTVLDEVTAAQFLAYAWEDRMPYGGSVHYIVDRITTANEDGTFTFKIGATIKNEYGTKVDATIEGDVGGTADAPVILDSILYTKDGQVFDY